VRRPFPASFFDFLTCKGRDGTSPLQMDVLLSLMLAGDGRVRAEDVCEVPWAAGGSDRCVAIPRRPFDDGIRELTYLDNDRGFHWGFLFCDTHVSRGAIHLHQFHLNQGQICDELKNLHFAILEESQL
jgi:hypothetical protein